MRLFTRRPQVQKHSPAPAGDHRRELRELAHRIADGIEVALMWCAADDSVSVSVRDHREGVVFELPVAPERAMHAFHHPFAYAA